MLPTKVVRPALALLLLVLVASPSGRAAEEDAPARSLPFGVRDTNAARYAIAEARRLLAAGRTLQGLQVAQGVLDEMASDYYLVDGAQASARWRLAVEEVRDVLARLDMRDREQYERIARPSAEPLLARARRLRDPAPLARVHERYGASRAGLEASGLLAQVALEEGRYLDAAQVARDALRFAPAHPVCLPLLVDALAAAGDRPALSNVAIPDGDAWQTLRERRRDALARMAGAREIEGWPVWGGNPGRTGRAPGAATLPDPLRWRVSTPLPQRDLDTEPMRGFGQDTSDQFWAQWEYFRPLNPVVSDRVLYVADGRAVEALDLYSGSRIWSFDERSPTTLALERSGGRAWGRTSLERPFTPVVAGDLVVATVEVRQPYEPEMLQQVEISTYLPRRVLVGLDRSTGRQRWTMMAPDVLGGALEGVSIVSPAVVAEGLVFAVGSGYLGTHNVSLLAFDLASGVLRWKRPICWGQQELNLFGAPVKELAASAPAVADGVVYASTGLGLVAAAETRTGRPLWLASYEIEPIQPVQYWFKAPLRFPNVSPSPPVIAGELLVVAPSDGRHLHAYDRRDGRLRWRVPYRAAPYGATAHFLGVVHDGQRDVALLTGTNLEAYELATGRLVWLGRIQEDFAEENVPVGRGMVAGDEILVPTTLGLSRFALSREGSFAGRDPWPAGAEPGNVLALPQVLVVAGRESVQGFWRWEEIERDIAARRSARPQDPWVLLEAAEIYRLGRAFDRAEDALAEATRLARAVGDTRAVERAQRGLFLTWTSIAAAYREASQGAEALAALAEALQHAREPAERVETRVRMDALLEAEPERRAENLARLVEEAEDVRAVFPGEETEAVPARAVALRRLAQLQLELGRPQQAVDSLQRLIREESGARVAGTSARDAARALLEEIRRVWGPAPYAQHEARAQRLLEEAERRGDGALLERILAEYPNATVVPEALLRLGARQVDAVQPGEAARILRSLIGSYPEDPRTAKAAALLARAYGMLGQEGAQRFALTWLATRHAASRFELDGREVTGLAVAETEMPKPRAAPEDERPATRRATGPLAEVHFERVDEDAWGRQIEVASEPGRPSPVALLSDGDVLVAFDLPGARVAFRRALGAVHRGVFLDDVLVLASTGVLRGLSPTTGRTLWEASIDGHVMLLEGARGHVYALLQDATGVTGSRSLVALDGRLGRPLWSIDLGQADYRSMRPHGADLLVRQARYERGWVWPAVMVVDGLTGRLRHVLSLPAQGRMEREPEVVGDRVVVVGKDAQGLRTITAHEIETGGLSWTRPLPGEERTSALLAAGDRAIVLQTDGRLTTFDVATGEPVNDTRIFVGDAATAYPYHGTDALVDGSRLVLMPLVRGSPYQVGAWSLASGKLAWDARWETEERLNRAILTKAGTRVLALASYTRPGAPARVLLQVLDAESGGRLQQVEPVGLLAEHGLLSLAEGWGTVVVFGRGGAGVYAGGEASAR